MVFKTKLSKKDCIRRLNDRFDSWFMFGQERYIGWARFSFFSIRYIGAREFYDKHEAATHKIIGHLKSTEEDTAGHYRLFRGYCEPISIVKWFIALMIGSFISFSINRNIDYAEISFWEIPKEVILLSLAISTITILLVSVASYIIAVGSERGQQGEKDLLWFLENTIKED